MLKVCRSFLQKINNIFNKCKYLNKINKIITPAKPNLVFGIYNLV